MNKKLVIGAAIFATTITAGCVTKSTYEQLEAEKNQQIATLQAERQTLQQNLSELQSQIQKLEKQRTTLEQNKAWLEQDQVALQTRIGLLAQEKKALEQQQSGLRAQIDELEQQKSQLLTSNRETEAQYDELVNNLTDEVKAGQLQITRYRNMLTVDVAEQLFFESGKADLKTRGKEVLKKVGNTLKGYDDKIIRVVGHTDNVPIAKAHRKVFASNWELSVARATTVVRYLQHVGIPPERMIASGRAQYAPVAPNDTAEGRKKNRRIEITLIDRALAQEVTSVRND